MNLWQIIFLIMLLSLFSYVIYSFNKIVNAAKKDAEKS